ncbi:MAG TPA: flagellar motor stator protein MotA [Gemmatimonadales bacterium]|nr:flagellar motor stator protein MotA [Gemmatimonadales bacterium]
MIAIIGLLVVIGAVVGGFTMAGGKLVALFHLSEIVVIGGVALGTVFVSTPGPVLKAMGGKLGGVFKGNRFTKPLYLDALKMLYELFQVARKDGLVAIEGHIEDPTKSAIFKKYPKVLHEHHAMEFLCDSLRLVLVGSVPPHDLDALMDGEMDVHHEEAAKPAAALQKVGDALPGIGIVAAVLGIVITMGAIAGPVEQIGEHVAAALTGTFLGVLMAYGFVGPLSTAIEQLNSEESRFFAFLKSSVVAFAKGFAPIVAVEFARRAIFSTNRPTFQEMEAACKQAAKAGK